MNRLFKSFGYAITGLKLFFRKEKNGQVELFAGILAVLLGFLLHISQTEWCVVLLCIGGVIALEISNSALEKLCNHLHPEKHSNIKIVKDFAAAAVLWFSMIAFVIGLIIFLPKTLSFFLH